MARHDRLHSCTVRTSRDLLCRPRCGKFKSSSMLTLVTAEQNVKNEPGFASFGSLVREIRLGVWLRGSFGNSETAVEARGQLRKLGRGWRLEPAFEGHKDDSRLLLTWGFMASTSIRRWKQQAGVDLAFQHSVRAKVSRREQSRALLIRSDSDSVSHPHPQGEVQAFPAAAASCLFSASSSAASASRAALSASMALRIASRSSFFMKTPCSTTGGPASTGRAD